MNETTETTDEANTTELEHCDGRADPARDGERASDERTTVDPVAAEYKPKVSNVIGEMNCGDYFPDDAAPDPARKGIYDDSSSTYDNAVYQE